MILHLLPVWFLLFSTTFSNAATLQIRDLSLWPVWSIEHISTFRALLSAWTERYPQFDETPSTLTFLGGAAHIGCVAGVSLLLAWALPHHRKLARGRLPQVSRAARAMSRRR